MARSADPHVSIVTPAYNAVSFIGDCVDSVLSQSYSEWDWTIVDNCSTDGTYEAVQALVEGDHRIRLRRNDRFLNVTENHNEAFRQISDSAKYCKVVAADDLLLPDCIASMVEVAEANPGVAIVGAYALERNRVRFDGVPFPQERVDGRQACREHLLGGPYVFGVPTSVLYRADIVRSRRSFYNERNIHSDSEVCFEFLANADFGFVHQVLCYLRVREGSETSYSERLDTYRYGMLQALLKYGREYLTESEWEALVARRLSEYRRFLGKQALLRRENEFWEYHLEKLDELGFPMTRLQVLWASAEFIASRLASGPLELGRGALKMLRR